MIQRCSHALSERFQASGGKPKPATIHHLPQSTNVRSDHQFAAHHLLDGSQSSSFLPNRRHQNCSYLVHSDLKGRSSNESSELNIFCKTEFLCHRLKFAPFWSVSNEFHTEIVSGGFQFLRCLQDQKVPFQTKEAAYQPQARWASIWKNNHVEPRVRMGLRN